MATATDARSPTVGTTVLTNVSPKLENYKFDRKCIGKCLIINNKHFNRNLTGQLDRDGTEIDGQKIESTFSRLGFEVQIMQDLTCMQMRLALREISECDHTDYDCFVCFILTHGKEREVIYGVDGSMNLYELIDKLKGSNCPTLVGKPKLFFIQACRGSYFDSGVDVTDGEIEFQCGRQSKISSEADIMIAYSVVPGHFSWRNNVDGSWFIQSLCTVLNSDLVSTTDLLGLMTAVSRLVSEKFESDTKEESTSGFKQVPWIVSTLTRLVYLKTRSQ